MNIRNPHLFFNPPPQIRLEKIIDFFLFPANILT